MSVRQKIAVMEHNFPSLQSRQQGRGEREHLDVPIVHEVTG